MTEALRPELFDLRRVSSCVRVRRVWSLSDGATPASTVAACRSSRASRQIVRVRSDEGPMTSPRRRRRRMVRSTRG